MWSPTGLASRTFAIIFLYIKDFQNSSNLLSFILFADDTSVFFSHKNPNALVDTVNTELSRIHEWICCNKLSLNVLKTHGMLFSNSISRLPSNVFLNNTSVDIVDSTKFLGLYIDNKLSWKKHATHLSKLLSRNVGIINKLKKQFSLQCIAKYILHSYSPLFELWNNSLGQLRQKSVRQIITYTKKGNENKLQQNRLAHSNELFYSNKVLKINDLFLLRLGCFMYQLNQGELPVALSALFSKNERFHNYPTRQSSFYHLPMLRTLYKQKTLIYTGPVYWNSLDESLTHSPSLFSFKRSLKQNQIDNYKDSI